MKIFLILLTCVSFTLNLPGQNVYKPLQCEGPIPPEFLTFTIDKIDSANVKYNSHRDNLSRKQFKKFNNSTNYYLDHLLKSGGIIFGTAMNKYVDSVGALVLNSFPEIKEQVRFYLVKSTTVNAFTTHQGIIFINLGLIAQLENEAQLAYVIAHELIHYKYKHSLNLYQHSLTKKQSRSMVWSTDNMDRFLAYSREQETMADSLGFLLGFANTKYDFNEAISVFDVFLYSNLPFDEIKFNFDMFNDQYFTLEDNYRFSAVRQISNPEDYDDSRSTHPNIKTRRTLMIDLITSMENPNHSKFLVSEEKFYALQKQARFELSNIYTCEMNYDRAFYNSYLLLLTYPDDPFLRKNMAYILYGVSVFKSKQTLRNVIEDEKELEGNLLSVTKFFKEVNKETLAALAVKYLWKYHVDFPQDDYMNKLLSLAIEQCNTTCDYTYDMIYKPPVDTVKSELAENFRELSEEEYNALSKYDKIRYDKKYTAIFGGKTNVNSTLEVKSHFAVLSAETLHPDFKSWFTGNPKPSIFTSDTTHLNHDDCDMFMLLNPIYFSIYNDELDVLKSVDGEVKYMKSLKKVSEVASLGMEILDTRGIKPDDTKKFNELALMQSWMMEYADLTNKIGDYYGIPWQSAYYNNLVNDHGTRYMLAMGFVAKRNYKFSISPYISGLVCGVFPYIGPVLFNRAVVVNNRLYHICYFVDLETNETLIFHEGVIEGFPSNDYLNNLNYKIMHKIKHKRFSERTKDNDIVKERL
ncbi:MAG TPA: M48 family metallopeptidase [Bacteroidales bacterium]|nr:M48 family metallopeptidase [Bacteroidales bacterium]HRZ47781.1 M48 family metallopeptidase [Bacteroidales bacterium]